MDLSVFDSLEHVLIYLVPGVIIMVVRARVISGRMPDASNLYLYYVTVSLIYHGLAFPLLGGTGLAEPSRGILLYWTYLIILPAAVGYGLGASVWWKRPRKWLSKIGIKLVHPVETAWDWKFAFASPQWVLVTLKDGTTFAGWLGEDSFISSRPSASERDLYVERVYAISDEDGTWIETENSIYVSAAQIKTIEFWPYSYSTFALSLASEVHDDTTQQDSE